MGTILFALGFVILMLLIALGVAFLIHEIMYGNSIITKILSIVFMIAIVITLLLIGLGLGVEGINI